MSFFNLMHEGFSLNSISSCLKKILCMDLYEIAGNAKALAIGLCIEIFLWLVWVICLNMHHYCCYYY